MADDVLIPASAGAGIAGEDLQETIDRLRAWAASLDAVLQTTIDVEEAQAAARLQQDLLNRATDLVVVQIDLITGEAEVTAVHINAATQYAQDVIGEIAEAKQRIAKLGQVLDFLAVLGTGSGAKIVAAAVKLKKGLDEA